MFEKVNPSHPDKVADRIAGALVDLAYNREQNPRIAVEVLLGHRHANIIAESSVNIDEVDAWPIIDRICGENVIENLNLICVPQDSHLADNQAHGMRCGDNGIFKGVATGVEETLMALIASVFYAKYPTDGKFIIAPPHILACQSCIDTEAAEPDMLKVCERYAHDYGLVLNPLGDWTGGLDVDCGATNRKLGSDMGRAVTGGGLHGKDLSKADVSVNIVCYILAQQFCCNIEAHCAIGDEEVEFIITRGNEVRDFLSLSYPIIVAMAGEYISNLGGFEKLAEWGLVR